MKKIRSYTKRFYESQQLAKAYRDGKKIVCNEETRQILIIVNS